MPTRRSHSNSHHGCMQCKQRRVKCDQLQPKCTRCVRRGAECTYRHMMSNYNPFQRPSVPQRQSSQQPRCQPSPTPSISSTSFVPLQTQVTPDFQYVFHSPEDTKSAIRATEEPFIKTEPTTSPWLPGNVPPPPPTNIPSTPIAFLKPEGRSTASPLPIKAEGPSNTSPPTPIVDHRRPSNTPPRPVIKTEPTAASEILAETFYPSEPSSVASTTAPTQPSFSTDRDAYLMHHYTNNLTVESNIIPSLNSAILNHAQTIPYVTHVVLAFSGLHLAAHSSSSSESAKYLYTALAHKDAALRLFMPAIGEGISPQTVEPQLAASAVLVACSLALPAADPGNRMNFDRIDILAEVAGLYQGTNHIYHHHAFQTLPRKLSSASESSSSCDSKSSPSGTPRSPGDNVPWQDAMESLQKCIDKLNAAPPVEASEEMNRWRALNHAAAKLQKAFKKISRARRDFNCIWLGMVDHQFVKLINGRDPMALLFLAHWAICRTNTDDIWWAKGWPAAAVTAIYEALDDEHRPLLNWCLSQVKWGPSSAGQHPLIEMPSNFLS